MEFPFDDAPNTAAVICSRCDECGSEFLKSSSKMMSLCPECAHILYGYPNCAHAFKNGRCIYCYWDGSRNEYIRMVLSGDGI